MQKILKITSMQCLCNIARTNWVMKLMFCMLISMKVFYKLIVFFFSRFDHACLKCLGTFAISFCHLKKEVRNEVAFLHLINCLCNVSSLLLFQVTVDPCKLASWYSFLRMHNFGFFGYLLNIYSFVYKKTYC